MIRVRDYKGSLSGPEAVHLLIEVTDISLSYDRNVKLPLYAQARIPEVWIVDLAGEVIERHTEPTGDDYRHTEKVRRGETFQSAALPGLPISTDAVLG